MYLTHDYTQLSFMRKDMDCGKYEHLRVRLRNPIHHARSRQAAAVRLSSMPRHGATSPVQGAQYRCVPSNPGQSIQALPRQPQGVAGGAISSKIIAMIYLRRPRKALDPILICQTCHQPHNRLSVCGIPPRNCPQCASDKKRRMARERGARKREAKA